MISSHVKTYQIYKLLERLCLGYDDEREREREREPEPDLPVICMNI